MYLQKLEAQGFKSFASRTILEFYGPKAKTQGVTAIVGPNGSGKSNVADAIRWVLGEQSMKLLRGKKSEDVIFSGSEKKARSGFAEVSLHLNNEDGKVDIEYPEVVITRRLYRDGESEYLVNNAKVRLQDIQLLLAKANFGERHYSVIGQGMIDSMLQLSPEERRDFFDEATGVKPFQIKKDQALGKLRLTEDNLARAHELLREIEPRLKSLSRQVKRLEERTTVESELHGLQHAYYLTLWRDLDGKIAATKKQLADAAAESEKKRTEVGAIRSEFSGLEKEETKSEGMLKLQHASHDLLSEKSALHGKLLGIESSIARAEAQATILTPLPLTKIISEIRGLGERGRTLATKIRTAKSLADLHVFADEIEEIAASGAELVERLERPPEEKREAKIDPALVKDKERAMVRIAEIDKEIARIGDALSRTGKEEGTKKSAVFAAQRRLEEKLTDLRAKETRENEIKVDLARLETRRESLEQEMIQELRERIERVRAEGQAGGEAAAVEIAEALARIQKLKYQMELIGGIDPEVVREHGETAERYGFLSTQTEDLRKSILDLETVIKELNKRIEEQFERSFRRLSDDFNRYFRILFNGGAAKLEKRKLEPVHTKTEEALEEGDDEEDVKPKTLAEKFASDEYTIEIAASPPGKKIRSIAMLSGGERAMTSIALICAIISNNPSPFVVLDEVDAALDESNSIRFASIVDELSEKSQFIVITHNRYTMEKSAVLYGVTMRDDGTSQLLSVSLEEARAKAK